LVTTVTTVTTVTSVAATAATISIAAVVILILLLIAKELTAAGQSLPSRLSSRFLDVATTPLVIVFAAIVAVRVIQVLA